MTPLEAQGGAGGAKPEEASGFAGWWSRLGRGQRIGAVVIAAVLVVNVSLSALQSMVGSNPGGPVSSSFSTGDDGLEGYADLLRAAGRPVQRLDRTLRASMLPTGSTVVIADPQELSADEVGIVARFVAAGGRLVVAGESAGPVLQAVTGQPVRWVQRDGVDALSVWVPVEATGSARTVAGDGGGRWESTGSLVPIVGSAGRPAVLVGSIGRGRVVAFADASPLHNGHLGSADNAELALAAAGPGAGRITFLESVHGFGAADTGLAAVPSAWRWTAAGALLAAIAALWSAGARFGPPEPAARHLRPARRAHVEAIAADLQRVSPAPADLAGALREGTARASAERHRRGIADLQTSPADPADRSPRGGPP